MIHVYSSRFSAFFTLCKSQKKKDQSYGNGSKDKEAGIATGSKKILYVPQSVLMFSAEVLGAPLAG